MMFRKAHLLEQSNLLPRSISIGLFLLLSTSISKSISANEQQHHHPVIEGAAFPYDPPDRGAPGDTQDAGSRPLCRTPNFPFSTIAPSTNWGETTQAYPTFWLYIPYAAGNVEFFLRDEQTQTELYRTVFTVDAEKIPDGGGIGAFQLPADAPPLELDTLYNWQFDFICNPETRSKFRVTGIVVRRSLSDELRTQLTTSSSLDTVFAYAEAGLWYDALASLVQLQEMSTPEVNQAWSDLLEHPIVDLGDLSSKPFLDCCN